MQAIALSNKMELHLISFLHSAKPLIQDGQAKLRASLRELNHSVKAFLLFETDALH